MTDQTDDPWRILSEDVFSGYRAWRAQHPRATTRELEAELDQRLARLRAQMLADSAMTSPATDWASHPQTEQPHCPACAQPLTPRGAHTRHLRSHHDQPVRLTRQYGTCPQCEHGFFPLDEELALPPGQLTPLLQEWVVHLGAWVPFGQVPRLLSCFAGLGIARETARCLTEAAGAHLVAAATAAAPLLAPPADPGSDTAARLLVSADGAMGRLQSGEWVAVKTVAVGQVAAQVAADGSVQVRTSDPSYFSRQAPVEDLTRQAVVELHRRGVRGAAAVAGVADEALWVQSFLDYHCAPALRILDLPHAAEHLGALAGAVWGEGTAAAQQWQHAQVRELRQHGAAAVLRRVAALARAHPENEAVAEHAGYRQRRAAQMDYPAFVAAGWPIGSGAVESANKLVVEARLKGAGMGWQPAALNPMLALRNTVCNDRWAEGWATVVAGQAAVRAQRWQRHGAGAPEVPCRSPAAGGEPPTQEAVNPVVVAAVAAILARVTAEVDQARAAAAPVNGKPGLRHPWRHSPISKAQREGAPM